MFETGAFDAKLEWLFFVGNMMFDTVQTFSCVSLKFNNFSVKGRKFFQHQNQIYKLGHIWHIKRSKIQVIIKILIQQFY